jgi:hypothetical protein
MNFNKFTLSHFPFCCEVSDGELANAATFNTQLASKEVDNDLDGKQNFNNVESASGPSVTNAQREINSLNSFSGRASGSAFDALPSWTSNDIGSSTDTLKDRAEAASAKFNDTTGHAHDGSAGGGAPVSAANLSNFNNYMAVMQTFSKTSASGTSTDVSTELTGKLPGGSNTNVGVYTSSPENICDIYTLDTHQQIEDSEGQKVYGRITESSGTWTLSFYTNEAGTETAHSLSSQDIRVYFAEVFTMATRPTRGADTGRIGSLDLTADVVDASSTQRGLVSTGTQNFAGEKIFDNGAIADVSFGAIGRVYLASLVDSALTGSNQTVDEPITESVIFTNGSLTSIRGIEVPNDGVGQKVILKNSTGNSILILNNNGASATEGILTGTGSDLELPEDAAISLFYDENADRWQIYGGTGGGSGGGLLTVYATESISAAGTITAAVELRELRRVQGNAAAVTANSTTPITAGITEGQELILKGMSDTNTVTILDSGNVNLNGDVTLYAGSTLSLVWIDSEWLEISRKI